MKKPSCLNKQKNKTLIEFHSVIKLYFTVVSQLYFVYNRAVNHYFICILYFSNSDWPLKRYVKITEPITSKNLSTSPHIAVTQNTCFVYVNSVLCLRQYTKKSVSFCDCINHETTRFVFERIRVSTRTRVFNTCIILSKSIRAIVLHFFPYTTHVNTI